MVHIAAMRALRVAACPSRAGQVLIEAWRRSLGPLGPYLRAKRVRLACDYVVISDTSKHDADTPSLTQATPASCKELIVQGTDNDCTAACSARGANPANLLVRIIASFHDTGTA